MDRDKRDKRDVKLSSNMEDYLEAIAILKKKYRVARVRDISRLLDVKTPSVTSALEHLSKNGLVVHERYGYVDLTAKGERLAKDCKNKHELLTKFLQTILSVNYRTAREDACKIEHSISSETSKKLTKFVEFVEACPEQGRPDWLKSFDYYYRTGRRLKCKMRQKENVER